MGMGAALRGLGAIMKGGKKTSPTISSVKPSVHKTKRNQKRALMKEQFDKQKSRTLSDRKMGKKEMTLTEYANRRTKKADGGPITPRKVIKSVVKDAKSLAKNKTAVTATIAGGINEVVKNEKKKKKKD